MRKLTIKEFVDKSNIEIIEELMKKNNGYITSNEVDMFDINRMYLSIMKKKGIIKKISSGIYIDSNKIEDNYYVFSLSMPNVIFSHMTALYFHGLSMTAPTDVYDVTVKRNYNSIHLRKHNVFYVDNAVYELGLIEIKTSMGNKVKAYDIERCIVNIVNNAYKFTNYGGYIKVEIKDLDDEVKIEISDNGIGIDKENYEVIFNRFNQIVDPNSEIKKGSGLGLTITKKIIDLHQGKIYVESQVGKGSKFIIILPTKQNNNI